MGPEHVPHPFRQFLLKVHSRCDLACDYCYVYTKLDQRWAQRPFVMTRRTIDDVALRIGEHVRAHRLPSIGAVFHGGEPLLAGLDRLGYCVRRVRSAVDRDTVVRFGIQTNGLGLDADRLRALGQWEVRISVSLDGDSVAHDRHRRRRNGSGSFSAVVAAVRELARPENHAIFAGLICAVDLDNDPVTTYEALVRHAPPRIDFLLPEGNWSHPPPGRTGAGPGTPYADWLVAVFDRWYDAPRRETGVRFFEDVITVLLGGRPTRAGAGIAPLGSVVVETDGSIEPCDALTATFPAAGVTGLSVADHTFDEALTTPLVIEQQAGERALAATCRSCRMLRVCGGGVFSHRYRAGRGFRNPSVYCPDLYTFISHVRRRLAADVQKLRPVGGRAG